MQQGPSTVRGKTRLPQWRCLAVCSPAQWKIIERSPRRQAGQSARFRSVPENSRAFAPGCPNFPGEEVPISAGRKVPAAPPPSPSYVQGRGSIPTNCPAKSGMTFWDQTLRCTRKSLQKLSRQSFDPFPFPVSTSRLLFSQGKSPALTVHFSCHETAVRSDGAQLSIKACQCASLGSLVTSEGLPASFMVVLLLLPTSGGGG